MTVDPRFERSVHRWLRAYPRRWRRERAAEVTALLADLAGPDATRLSAGTVVGLVRAGWATRLRTRPPLRHVLAYRLIDRRVPAPYRGWVSDDIEGEGSPLRVLLNVAVVVAVVSVLLPLAIGDRPHTLSGGSLSAVFAMSLGFLLRGSRVRRARGRKHLVPEAGEELTSETLLFGWVLRDRLTARGTTGLLIVGLATAALAALAACLAAPTALGAASCGHSCVATVSAGRDGVPVPLTVALVSAVALGGLAGLHARATLRRLVPLRPVQHSRRLVAPTPRHRAIVLVLTAGAVGIAWIEGTGRVDLFFSVAVAVAVLLALPALVVAWRVARTGPDDLAFVDVWSIVSTGRLPRVDAVEEGLVPALLATD
ncbi:hypothetical protein HP550_03825 [Cellulomonas humilata]|uniref:Uncharacterized protein n=1 Tax=Cellulomonas humilata TaxID=144055 RepID=A0A7Y6DWK3_9CELL|nr:hypothetical protein [Cellulomonas humilata]NUU16375.1 hypothetical protein [Cellulomonas humilata]